MSVLATFVKKSHLEARDLLLCAFHPKRAPAAGHQKQPACGPNVDCRQLRKETAYLGMKFFQILPFRNFANFAKDLIFDFAFRKIQNLQNNAHCRTGIMCDVLKCYQCYATVITS